jgi:hypothetical protein
MAGILEKYSRFWLLQSTVMIYPNPVISEFTLTASADLPESINLRIIDNGGRILQRHQWLVSSGSNSLVINVRGLAKGIYYLQIEGKTIRKNLKFINQ